MSSIRAMQRRNFLKGTFGAAALSSLPIGPMSLTAPAWASSPLVVVELFTSQGCNSCPPADKLLGELAERENILALSLNVDYWDYLGWTDTLARPENAERQRSYAKTLGKRQVYTPQMVINGRADFVGSRRSDVLAEIEKQGSPANAPLIEMNDADEVLTISIGAAPVQKSATVWLVKYDRKREVEIEAGENRNSKIAYHNVVRGMAPVGMWSGAAQTLRLPKGDLDMVLGNECAVLIQEAGTGPIIAAHKFSTDQ